MDNDGLEIGEISSDELKWQRGIGSRWSLLVYCTSKDPDETCTFMNDCKLLNKALHDNQTVIGIQNQRPISHVTSDFESEAYFLSLVAERELIIQDNLNAYLRTQYEHWKGSKTLEILQDLYLRIRLVKAYQKVFTRMTNFKNATTEDNCEILEVILGIWRAADNEEDSMQRGKLLIRAKLLLDQFKNADRTIEKDGKNDPKEETHIQVDDFLQLYENNLLKCKLMSKASSLDAKHEIRNFAKEIFDASLYVSGFPVHPTWYADLHRNQSTWRVFFSNSRRLISRLGGTWNVTPVNNDSQFKEVFVSTTTGNDQQVSLYIQENLDQMLAEVIKCLACWKTNGSVPDQWLFSYYSGHGTGPLQLMPAFSNQYNIGELSSEIFTDVVIALDCCYPHTFGNQQEDCLRVILPNKGKSPEHMQPNWWGTFTLLLCYVIDGVDPKICIHIMAIAYGYKMCYGNAGAPCPTCEQYMRQFKENNDLCKYCENLKKKLADSKSKFLFPSHVDEHLKRHMCQLRKGPPYVTLPPFNMKEIPLALKSSSVGKILNPLISSGFIKGHKVGVEHFIGKN